MTEQSGFEIFRALSRNKIAEHKREFERKIQAVVHERAAKGQLRSGGTLSAFSRLAEAEIKDRTHALVDDATRVLANEDIAVVDATSVALKQSIETSANAAYAETWTNITSSSPFKGREANAVANALSSIQWQLSEIRNEQMDLAMARIDLAVRERKGQRQRTSRPTRKIAVIASLDIAGYSARAEADEAAAINDVLGVGKSVREIADRSGGRVFNSAGDGFMLEFVSATSAIEATVDLVKIQPAVRVGVHIGDVTVDSRDDLLGHAVNVASRLQHGAAPSNALVSADVRRMIRDDVASRLVRPRAVKLEKMTESIEAFEIEA